MARRLPPLNALRAFEASARLGSFVAAAAELHVSAAAVSQHVRRLERYLDVALFRRLARGLVLTEEGRAYWPELATGFALLGESTARLRAQQAGGVLTLTMLAAFASGWLLPRLHRFRERAPRIEVVLRTSRALVDFRREDVDLAQLKTDLEEVLDKAFTPVPGRKSVKPESTLGFDRVVDRVPDEMDQGIGNLFEHVLVDLRLPARYGELYTLVPALGELFRELCKPPEYVCHRQHPQGGRALFQFPLYPSELRGIRLHRVGRTVRETVGFDGPLKKGVYHHDFIHNLDEAVEFPQVDAHG